MQSSTLIISIICWFGTSQKVKARFGGKIRIVILIEVRRARITVIFTFNKNNNQMKLRVIYSSFGSARIETLGLLIDLLFQSTGIGQHALREPQRDFLFSVFNRVRAVDQVATNINAEITTEGSRSRIQRVGSSQNGATSFDNRFTSPDLHQR